MKPPVIIDANLLLLLVAGSAGRQYISMHGNLGHYSATDFEILTDAISGLFSEIILVPHVVAEVSSLARQIRNPARSRIQEKFRELVETAQEIPAASIDGAARDEFDRLGITDAVLLHLCMTGLGGLDLWLLTADLDLAVQAEMLGYGVLNFRDLR